jgi:GntR family transcriptional regulator/MocR family aminotransferase
VSENRTTGPLEVLLPVRRGAGSLRGQVEHELRGAIRSGRLPAGTNLPSTRALSAELGVSRGVVVEAYEQLVAEGYLLARQGSGTRVAATATVAQAPRGPGEPQQHLRYDFRPGVPALETFPRAAWAGSLRTALATAPHAALGYGDPRGLPALRDALAAHLGRVRGVAADASRLLVCSGFAQGLGLVCRALRRGGARRFAIEDPCHPGQPAIVAHAGLEPVPVPVDERGLRVDLLGSRADAVLVTPAHQFPTGAVLAPERRASLVGWAERHGAVVVEDDYDAEYRYDREPVGALQGLAPERVVYAGSASKTLAPALRLGWLVLPAGLAGAVTEEKALDDLATSGLEQLAFADFLSRGELDRHLRRNRAVYRSRRDALVSAIEAHLPGVTVGGIAAGLHAVAELPPKASETAVVEAARERSVGVYGAAGYRLPGRPGPAALVLGYGGLGERAIEAGVRLLAQAPALAAS